jgi:hypothetical protein
MNTAHNTARTAPTTNRETWLNEAAAILWPMIEAAGTPRAGAYVSVGFPSARALSTKKRTIGQCWNGASADGKSHVFVSPVLNDTVEVLGVLAHELIHAATPGAGHKGAFAKVARAFGLAGKLTATTVPAALGDQLLRATAALGPYPHPAFDPSNRPTKKQGTRMLKIECPECGYTVRSTAKWIEVGLPTCVCGAEMVAV